MSNHQRQILKRRYLRVSLHSVGLLLWNIVVHLAMTKIYSWRTGCPSNHVCSFIICHLRFLIRCHAIRCLNTSQIILEVLQHVKWKLKLKFTQCFSSFYDWLNKLNFDKQTGQSINSTVDCFEIFVFYFNFQPRIVYK